MSESSSLPKVLKVIDDKVVINRGFAHDIKVGSVFLVFGDGGVLQDPDTGEDLGSLEIVRGRAKAVHVQERLSTLESIEFEIQPGVKKKISRRGGIASFAYGIPEVEEIEEGEERRQLGLDAKVGDFARPI